MAKSATYVLWNFGVEAPGIYISSGYILSCTILFGFYSLMCSPVMWFAHWFNYQGIWSRGHGGIQGMSTSAQIYPHSSDCSLRYVLNSECHPTHLSSPHIAAYAQGNDPVSSDRTGNISNRKPDNYLLDVPDARCCSVCNHDCLYLSIQKGNRTPIGPECELVPRITSHLSLAKKSKSSGRALDDTRMTTR